MKRDDHAPPVALSSCFPSAHLASLLNSYVSPSVSEPESCTSSQCSEPSSQRSDGTVSTAASSILSEDDVCDFAPSRLPVPSIPQSCAQRALSSLCDPIARSLSALRQCPWRPPVQQLRVQVPVPPELRRNPRRTSHSATSRTGCPPSLTRQSDRKGNFVDNLVDSSTHIVEAIWPTSSVACHAGAASPSVLPLRTFIQETLRRSRTSYSTLQVALYYLILIKPHVAERDFTMEQLDDCHASRAVQCGRRMFLAALILASKYLQDRNYSTRAWSKISGLNTCEINRNETAFLLAVNWKLHISDAVYNRWTDCVMRYTPSLPPSPGGASSPLYHRQVDDFRSIVLKLNPELDNIDDLAPLSPTSPLDGDIPTRSLFTPPSDQSGTFGYDGDFALTPRGLSSPVPLEPSLRSSACTPDRFAPALGLLPTPRLTPQTLNLSIPAVSAPSGLAAKSSSMSFALAQASCASAMQSLDRWSVSQTSSPLSYVARRSSLATTVSTASSPESMISDISRTSRSSSISSASSLASAPASKLDVQARCRYAKQCFERFSMKPTIASVPEDYESECAFTASPDLYTGTVGKGLCTLSLETHLARMQRPRPREMDEAALALQELRRRGSLERSRSAVVVTTPTKPSGLKRCRSVSIDKAMLQDNVRELLGRSTSSADAGWWEDMVCGSLRSSGSTPILQVPVRATAAGSHKRVCCSSEAAEPGFAYMPSAVGGSTMWRDYQS